MASSKENLKGADALRALEALSGVELKDCRQLVEQAALADITSYFKGADLGPLPPTLSSSLVSAAIAGGQQTAASVRFMEKGTTGCFRVDGDKNFPRTRNRNGAKN